MKNTAKTSLQHAVDSKTNCSTTSGVETTDYTDCKNAITDSQWRSWCCTAGRDL